MGGGGGERKHFKTEVDGNPVAILRQNFFLITENWPMKRADKELYKTKLKINYKQSHYTTPRSTQE